MAVKEMKKTILLNSAQRPFRILSIDGGGMRGLLPLTILQEIEKRTGKSIAHLFDFIIGNSTGGIIALCLTAPGKDNQPKYTAKDATNFYYENASTIFSKSFFRSLTTGFGLWAPKYNRSSLDKLLHTFFPCSMRLSQGVCPVMVTSYSLTNDALSLWTSYRSQKETNKDIAMADAAGATSAAPTYFAPKQISLPNGSRIEEIDGGIYANDPEEIAVTEALFQNPGLRPEQIFLLSLGTGKPKLKKKKKQWLRNPGILAWFLKTNLIDIILNAEEELEEFQTESTSLFQRYRLQFTIDPNFAAMDEVAIEKLDALLDIGKTFVQTSSDELARICTFLNQR